MAYIRFHLWYIHKRESRHMKECEKKNCQLASKKYPHASETRTMKELFTRGFNGQYVLKISLK